MFSNNTVGYPEETEIVKQKSVATFVESQKESEIYLGFPGRAVGSSEWVRFPTTGSPRSLGSTFRRTQALFFML